MGTSPEPPQLTSVMIELESLAVGMWKARKSPRHSLYMLLLPTRFVFICEKGEQQLANRFEATGAFIGAHSPFMSALYKDKRCVFAFEVDYGNVCGVNYNNPLLQHGRLVLEGNNISKLEFPSLDDVKAYYATGKASTPSTPKSRSPSLAPPSPSYTKKLDIGANASVKTNLSLKFKTSALTEALKNEPVPELTFRANLVSPRPAELANSPSCESVGTPTLGGSKNTRREGVFQPQKSSEDDADPMPTPRLHQLRPMSSPIASPNPRRQATHSPEIDVVKREHSWPSACAFTSTVRVYDFRQITITFSDPQVPALLRPVFESNERLLKKYESGLPVWAVLMPHYGLYYRPWLRKVTRVLFYLFSFFSLAAGFYDLYKTLPGLHSFLARASSALWLPGAALLDWLENHAQIRLSILLTYLFGKSELFVMVMRWANTALQPVTTILGPPAAALWSGVSVFASETGTAIISLMYTALSPFIALVSMLWTSLATTVAPIVMTIHAVFIKPVALLWSTAVQTGKGLAAGAAAVSATAGAGRQLASATPSASWTAALVSSEAFIILKESGTRAARALQAVWRFVTHVIGSAIRHRLTLSRRLHRQWRRAKVKLLHLLWLPVQAGMLLVAYFIRELQKAVRREVSDAPLPQPQQQNGEQVKGEHVTAGKLASLGKGVENGHGPSEMNKKTD